MANLSTSQGTNQRRPYWVFTYKGDALLYGAKAQLEFRLSRVKAWKDAKDKIMAEIRQSGIEITESVASSMNLYSKSNTMAGRAPTVSIRADLEEKLVECHNKIEEHQRSADQYQSWVAILESNKENTYELTYDDWLYFFFQVKTLDGA